MNNIIELNQKTLADIDADKVLNAAIGKTEEVVVIGYAVDGNEEFYFASSTANLETILFMLEKIKHEILRGDYS